MLSEKDLLQSIAFQLKSKGLFLALAESCTGGLCSHLITNLPGASDFYLGGQVAYSYQSKRLWLHVPPETLETYGAVSRETVLAMASGIRAAFAGEVDINRIIGVSISGIAGPSGGTPAKPVGTVWIALSVPAGEHAYHFQFAGEREAIKAQSALKALELLNEHLTQA